MSLRLIVPTFLRLCGARESRFIPAFRCFFPILSHDPPRPGRGDGPIELCLDFLELVPRYGWCGLAVQPQAEQMAEQKEAA